MAQKILNMPQSIFFSVSFNFRRSNSIILSGLLAGFDSCAALHAFNRFSLTTISPMTLKTITEMNAPAASNMNASDNRLCFRNFLKFVVMLDALYADYSTLIISTKELKDRHIDGDRPFMPHRHRKGLSPLFHVRCPSF